MNLSKNADVKGRKLTAVEGKPLHGDIIVKPLITGNQMTLLEIQYSPGAGASPHIHQHESLAYVVKGKVKMTVGKEEYILNAGDVCRHPQGVLHSVEGVDASVVVEIKSPAQPIEQFLGVAEK